MLGKMLAKEKPTAEKAARLEVFTLQRQRLILAARKDLYIFCQVADDADFYSAANWHLKILCFVLQSLYERTLTKRTFGDFVYRTAPQWYYQSVDWDHMDDDRIYRKLIINMPPRTGKSRTLVNFSKWAYGQDTTNKIITGSYNDTMAQTFSRNVRDGIQADKNYEHEIVYSDIFPNTLIKYGDSSYGKWALKGRFFSYKGTGTGGTVTGLGCNIAITDDPVKDAAEAFNELRLATIWEWWASTFRSRLEKDGIQIVNMTRWAERDVCGHLLNPELKEGKRHREWFVLKMVARDKETGELLCPALLDHEMLDDLADTLDENIYVANYEQQPVDKKGKLYAGFNTYKQLPPSFEAVINYTDTADTGEDYLCSITFGVLNNTAYVLDVIYTKDHMEETEPEVAKALATYRAKRAYIESNNGGRGFARQVKRILKYTYKGSRCTIHPFTQSDNKRSRIFTNSKHLQRSVLFPENWKERFPEYYVAMRDYKAEGRNVHDDAPDATTGVVEYIDVRQNKVNTALQL